MFWAGFVVVLLLAFAGAAWVDLSRRRRGYRNAIGLDTRGSVFGGQVGGTTDSGGGADSGAGGP